MKDQTKERLHNFHKGFEKNVSPYLFILPFFIFFVVFALTPVVMSLILSFMEWDYSSSATWVGLKNYQLIFDLDTLTGSEFWKSVAHTLLFAVIEMPLLIIIPFFIAFLLNHRLKGLGVCRSLIYLPAILSISTVGIIFVVLLDTNLGVINKIFHTDIPWLTKQPYQWISIFLLSTWWGIGGNMVLFTAGLQGISKDLYEAADMEGCSHIEKLRYVTLPGLKNIFVYVMTMTTLSCFNVMGQPMMLTPGDESTQVAIQFIYNTAFGGWKLGRASAMSIIMALLMGVFSFLALRKAIQSGRKENA